MLIYTFQFPPPFCIFFPWFLRLSVLLFSFFFFFLVRTSGLRDGQDEVTHAGADPRYDQRCDVEERVAGNPREEQKTQRCADPTKLPSGESAHNNVRTLEIR